MDGTIIDRINNSGRRLALTKTDIGQELSRLADTQDANGLQALFSAYCQWEQRQTPGEDPQAQRTRCLDNFYVAAQIGDCIKSAGGDAMRGFIMYEDNPEFVGAITQFVSNALQYVPPPQPTEETNQPPN